MDVTIDQQLAVILQITALLQTLDFLQENLRIEDNAVADNAALAFMQDAGRDQVQDDFFFTDDQGMAGIVTALKTDDIIRILGVDIDNFALAFVTPLGTNNNQI